MINNRQNGRRRGRGGGQRQGGGGQGQRDSGNRIDSRARGNAAQLLEKYKNMARDAQMSGDRVNTEYYLQFADHYFRVLADQRGRTDDQPQQRRQRDDFDQFDDVDDFGDEGEPVRAEEQPRASEADMRPRREQARDDRSREERSRDDRSRDDRSREERGTDYRRDGREPREDRLNGYHAERGDTPPRPAAAPADPTPMSVETAPVPAEAEKPRRRTRKPREEASAEPAGLDADRLPPSLGTPVANDDAGDAVEEAPKPRRRRVRSAAAEVTPAE